MSQINIDSILINELKQLEGLHGQNLETGAGIGSGNSYLKQYTNRLFGAPYQLLDSVDRRFPSVNPNLGNEYLRNFILNAPILHIRPGLPKYTGRDAGLVDSIKSVYMNSTSGNMSFASAMLSELASSTIFNKGSQLQKRMFGFRETYFQYIQHVNYMCRSMATFLSLSTNTKFPPGIMTNNGIKDFRTMEWENYRMLSGTKYTSPIQQLNRMGGATLIGATVGSVGDIVGGALRGARNTANDVAKAINQFVNADDSDAIFGNNTPNSGSVLNSISGRFKNALSTSVSDVIVDKVSSVQFMVEPTQFNERLDNSVENSMIESAIDGLQSAIGSEIAFITGSNVDLGLVDNITQFLGSTVQTASSFLQGIVEPVTGGFASNLFSGAMRAVKGQKMIYPKIYKHSESSLDYQFTVNLHSPYGDVYNYYINIVVPLMHLIALAAPRMVTSNSVTSPFLVQTFIPGQCTCQLGIISNMEVIKNPTGKRVSVHGFPLDVKVTFTVTELYNALSISPANDPASFLFNETLNDYMSNLAGLMPSVDTYTKQRKSTFENMQDYFSNKRYVDDIANRVLTGIEDTYNPFARG